MGILLVRYIFGQVECPPKLYSSLNSAMPWKESPVFGSTTPTSHRYSNSHWYKPMGLTPQTVMTLPVIVFNPIL